jgi:DNA-binding GntR family transcriptional regulator
VQYIEVPIPVNRPPVDRSLLRDDVYGRLRDAIVDGTFAPGEQLKDGELATWLGVSRTPVREALLRLAEGGLVVAHPGRSTVVTSLDVRSTREARDVVAAMHELAVREAVGLFTEAHLDAMREAADRFTEALDAGDIDAALRADDVFHDIPVKVAGSRAVAKVLEQFMPVLRRIERVRFGSAEGRRSPDRHEELIRLCAAGDVDAAAAVAFETWHSLPVTAE